MPIHYSSCVLSFLHVILFYFRFYFAFILSVVNIFNSLVSILWFLIYLCLQLGIDPSYFQEFIHVRDWSIQFPIILFWRAFYGINKTWCTRHRVLIKEHTTIIYCFFNGNYKIDRRCTGSFIYLYFTRNTSSSDLRISFTNRQSTVTWIFTSK